MPKPLQQPPPISAVSRFLNEDGVSRALRPPESASDAPRDHPQAFGAGKRTVKREFVLTAAAANTMDALVEALRQLTGARVSGSHALRAMLIAVEGALPLIGREIVPGEAWRLPANGARFEASRTSFEQRLGEVLLKAVQHARRA